MKSLFTTLHYIVSCLSIIATSSLVSQLYMQKTSMEVLIVLLFTMIFICGLLHLLIEEIRR